MSDSKWNGKQLQIHHPKSGNVAQPGVLFSKLAVDPKKHFVPYDVGNSYLEKYPLEQRQLGFGSKDPPKMGEFMSMQRSCQHKTSVEKELESEKDQIRKKGPIDSQLETLRRRIECIDEKFPEFAQGKRPENDFVADVSKHLYNIGRNTQGTTRTFLKDQRDRFYSQKKCIQANKPRIVQGLATSNMDYGRYNSFDPALDRTITTGPPLSGKTKFFDDGHLHLNYN